MDIKYSTEHCWVLHDGAAGNRLPAIALCKAMQWTAHEVILQPNQMAKWFSPANFLGAANALGDDFSDALRGKTSAFAKPKYAIGCGRQAALATRLMKQHTGIFSIQLLNPRMSPRLWDVLITPEHDQLNADNSIHIQGSVHNIHTDSLAIAHEQFAFLDTLASPRTLVLIGGPSKMAKFDEGMIEVMFSQLEYTLAMQGGSLMICGSRRTPIAIAQQLRARFGDGKHRVWFDESDGDNFYCGALAWADRIVSTPDSVNMISEACATNAPVFIAQPKAAYARMQLFFQPLFQRNRIQAQTKELVHFQTSSIDTMTPLINQLRARLPSE